MNTALHTHLSRRESQIMDVVFRLGEASVSDVVARIPDGPAYNSVRVTLGILEKKGYLRHRQEGPRYLYRPAVSPEKAKASALRHLLQTFFDDSLSQAILTLLDLPGEALTQDELDRLAARIERARQAADAAASNGERR